MGLRTWRGKVAGALLVGSLVAAPAAVAAPAGAATVRESSSIASTVSTPAVVPVAELNVYDAAHTGFRSSQFVPGANLSTTDYGNLLQSYRWTEPDLVWVSLGANDYLHAGRSPSGLAADLTRIVDDLRALPTSPSVIIGVPHELVGHDSAGRTWAEYGAAIEGVATSRGTGLVRVSDVIPQAGSGSPLLSADGLHYSNAGQAAIATALTDYLSATLTTRPAWASSWLTAVAGTRADVLAIGDSLTEGQGASKRSNRWLDVFRGKFRSRHVLPARYADYVPASYAVYGESRWGYPYTNPTGATTRSWAPALGFRAMELRPGSVTYTLTGTSAQMWITNGGGTTLTTSVDGAAPVTRTMAPWTYQKVDIPLGAQGAHQVRITTPTKGYAVLSGFRVTVN